VPHSESPLPVRSTLKIEFDHRGYDGQPVRMVGDRFQEDMAPLPVSVVAIASDSPSLARHPSDQDQPWSNGRIGSPSHLIIPRKVPRDSKTIAFDP
jgi:hypothetical protein